MKKKAKKSATQTISGQPSWKLSSSDVELYVTQQGAQVGPITFDRKGKRIKPMSVAPWHSEKLGRDVPKMLQALRGDFFCLPFGGNEHTHRGEQHPPHGETANAKWKLEGLERKTGRSRLHLSLKTRIRSGRVDKQVMLVTGHNAVYQQHVISQMKGPMNLGHHAMLKFPEAEGSGLISTSPTIYGQVCPQPFEVAAEGGYFSLQTAATFDSLAEVPSRLGGMADLSRYPLREGWEDLVLMVADDQVPFAWTAVAFPTEGYVWFALKDPRVLRQTVLWLSNGGRHYGPWNSRHRHVMGLEEVTSYFHFGLHESARANTLTRAGWPTTLKLSARTPTVVNYIMGVAPIPKSFGRVRSIEAAPSLEAVTITAESGKKVKAVLDVGFLHADPM